MSDKNIILLTENISANEGNIIMENSSCNKGVSIHGIFAQAAIRNRNNRIYPLSEMCNAITKANEEIVREGGIFGELDHPNGATVNLDRVSHIITELYMEGNNVIGRAKLLNTPMGLIAKALYESGRRVGISTRGGGRLNESGEVSGFTFITADLVCNNSAPDAKPTAIYEALEDTAKGRKVLTLAESILQDESAQKHLMKAFNEFFETLKIK